MNTLVFFHVLHVPLIHVELLDGLNPVQLHVAYSLGLDYLAQVNGARTGHCLRIVPLATRASLLVVAHHILVNLRVVGP